jgi:hypothetical protein
MPTFHLRALVARQPLRLYQIPRTSLARPFSQAPVRLARKDTQDKDSLKPEPNEYSKSGSDDAAAATANTAFDPNKTSPEEEHASADSESKEVGTSASLPPFQSPVDSFSLSIGEVNWGLWGEMMCFSYIFFGEIC